MRVLVIAYDVAPLELISSQRVNHFIEFFVKKGHHVEVLTSDKRAIDGPILAYKKYYSLKNVANFIELSSSLIGDKRETVNTLNSDSMLKLSECNKKQNLLLTFRNFAKIIRSTLIKVFGQFFDYRTIWAYNAIQYLKKSNKWDYDLVITSSLPVSVVWIGYVIKKNNPNILWVADFRDLWSLNSLVNYSFFSRRIDTFLEKKLLKNCDMITTVSSALKQQLQTLHSQEIVTVRNGLILEEYKDLLPNSIIFKDRSKINIVYAGNIYQGKRDPSELFKFIGRNQLFDKVNIYFFCYYASNLLEIIKKEQASNYAFILDPLPRKDIFEILKAADINLFLESGEEKDRGNISGKVFELLGIGKPILSIGPQEDFESTKIIKESGLYFEKEMLLSIGKNENDMLFVIEDHGCKRNSQLSRVFEISRKSISQFTRDFQVNNLYDKILERRNKINTN